MRLAVLIIALVTIFIMLPFSCLSAGGAGCSQDEAMENLAASSILITLALILGAAFIMHFPLVSVIIFFIGSIISLTVRMEGYPILFGIPLWLLTFLSILGYFELRKKRQV